MTPVFWGKLGKVSGYPFPIMTNIVETPADKVMPSCQEIAAARKAAKVK